MKCKERETEKDRKKCYKGVTNYVNALMDQGSGWAHQTSQQAQSGYESQSQNQAQVQNQNQYQYQGYNPIKEKILNRMGWTQINPIRERILNRQGWTQRTR